MHNISEKFNSLLVSIDGTIGSIRIFDKDAQFNLKTKLFNVLINDLVAFHLIAQSKL